MERSPDVLRLAGSAVSAGVAAAVTGLAGDLLAVANGLDVAVGETVGLLKTPGALAAATSFAILKFPDAFGGSTTIGGVSNTGSAFLLAV